MALASNEATASHFQSHSVLLLSLSAPATSLRTPLPQRLRFAANLRASRSLIPSSAPCQRRSISRVKWAASSGDSITSNSSSF